MSLSVSNLAYAHPDGSELFDAISFKVPTGAHVGLIGPNGVGKSTLMRVLAGRLAASEGTVHADGTSLYMSQDVGASEGLTVRRLLCETLAPRMAQIAAEVASAEAGLAGGDLSAGMRLGEWMAEWSDAGGYQAEAAWDEACRRVLDVAFDDVADWPIDTFSGGERKQLLLEVLFASDARLLLLDEPDNHLDVPAKLRLEARIRTSPKTILVISHDRELLTHATTALLTIEGHGCWWHGGSYATYPAARTERQERLARDRRAWQEEEKRLRELVRVFKERARYSPDWAPKAKAMESRWQRWVDTGAPPAPVADERIVMRIRGGDSARRVVNLEKLGIDGLVRPFSEEIYFGERVGLVGPNGTGKSHLLRALAGEAIATTGDWSLGPRVVPGFFTQHNVRAEWIGASAADVLGELTGSREKVLQSLARYRLVEAASRDVETLSGGQRARLEILCLELAGANLLLLDEPTDNLDLNSAEALEDALDAFEGTVLCVSHDRTFLGRLDRYLHLDGDGAIVPVAGYDRVLELLSAGACA